MDIAFLLNGETVRLTDPEPTQTLLDWLRNDRGLIGTKEGCNEGDCGACSVVVTDKNQTAALNACILFLPQIDGKAIRTVEGISAPDGTPHPVQKAMIDLHGSQCGFCTPGFIASMAAAHQNGRSDHDDQLAGNLCRCTGYAPIIKAAELAEAAPKADWLEKTPFVLPKIATEIQAQPAPEGPVYIPQTGDELAEFYADNPDATLIAGATDIGLWVTKQLRALPKIAFLNQISDLAEISETDDAFRFGAMVSIEQLRTTLTSHAPSFAQMLRRFASAQVRASATIGGNIANGSPIGDTPPALIALDATLHLRKSDVRRDLPLEDYFVDYGKQDIQPGEFVEGVSIPKRAHSLSVHKLSKRFDQDISAVLGAFNIIVENDKVSSARIAFGGMAGIPKRASAVEAALTNRVWNTETVAGAIEAFGQDFAPLSDMRASADYRLEAAQNMLWRVWHEDQGTATSVLEVTA
ncbi:MAG: xanthine dehydrogenase small subunit [Paracoccaceae bacterium]|nr:xanthine dehydrogenase small subunit [Paracoccaceae bacterium]MDG1738968.1 xanthine dehydrogenase small subunit [Paracoccaceae bacterium]MDG2258058.1 xanthine dehydrogenase small subunit [Paracoccaceae bacterium]